MGPPAGCPLFFMNYLVSTKYSAADNIDDVLRLRDEFLRGIGMTDQDVMRAARSPEQAPCGRKGGRLVN